MRNALFGITTILVLVVLNLLIVQKQMILASGQTMLLQLALSIRVR